MGTRAQNYIAIKPGVFKSKEALADALMLDRGEVEVFDRSVGALVVFETNMQPMSFRGGPRSVAYPGCVNFDLVQELRIQDAMSAWSPDVFFARRVGEYDSGERGAWLNHPFRHVDAVLEIDAEYDYLTKGLSCTVFTRNAVTNEQEAQSIRVPYGESVLEAARRVADGGVIERIADEKGDLFVPKGDQLEFERDGVMERMVGAVRTFLSGPLPRGPSQVIGFEPGGNAQKNFDLGWNSCANRLYGAAAPLRTALQDLSDLGEVVPPSPSSEASPNAIEP